MISERFQCQSFQEVQESLQEQLQDQSSQNAQELQELQEVFFSMSACGQDVMCSDTRACALGQEHGLIMSACAVGTVKSVGKGTMCDEMLSQLKEVASSLLERRGVVFSEGSTVLPQRSLQKETSERKSSRNRSHGERECERRKVVEGPEEGNGTVERSAEGKH